MVARITIIIITIINSMIVNPRFARRLRLISELECPSLTIDLPNPAESSLPVRILRSVKRRARGLAVNIEHVLAPPGRRVRIVLHRAQTPVVVSSHGIDWFLAKKSHVDVLRPGQLHSINKCVEVGWVVLGAGLHLEQSLVRSIAITIDGVAHLAQVVAEELFPLANHG